MTKVFNLATGETQEFTCEPVKAVICAHEQEKKNFNTWTYDFTIAKITSNGRTVYCGNWTSIIHPDDRLMAKHW